MKYIWWIIGSIALMGGLFVVVLLRPMPQSATIVMKTMADSVQDSQSTEAVKSDTTAKPTPVESQVTTPVAAPGRYMAYSSDLIDDSGYQTTILFFYAGWCPECRGYDQALDAATIPDGTQILQVTYDDSQDLRQKYGVTIQSTFVRVNSNGDKQVLWNGYGKEKSLDAIIENTK